MSDKPSLTVVGSTGTRRQVRQTGRDLFEAISTEYDLETGSLALLRQTADAQDRLNQIAAVISKDGIMQRWGKGKRAHPLLRIEQSLRVLVSQNIARLGLDLEPIGDIGRPGRGHGVAFDDDDAADD